MRAAIAAALAPHGLSVVAEVADAGDAVALIDFAKDGWAKFARSRERRDGAVHPLDRWSERVIGAVARDLGLEAAFPFGGPPYAPFLRWANGSASVWPSALGMSIHAERGVWVAFRGAILLPGLAPAEVTDAVCPCDGCTAKPCLSACPVDAFGPGGYDADACAAHLHSGQGGACLSYGCLARRACPVGVEWIPPADKAAFHMAAFSEARRE